MNRTQPPIEPSRPEPDTPVASTDATGGLGDWQPMKTAPKDGTRVLIWNPEGHEIAHWVKREEDGPDQPGHNAGWMGTYAFPGRSWGYRLRSDPQGQPTHWMPLPGAPGSREAHPIAVSPVVRELLVEARDLLTERIQGSPARSASHNARLVIERALAALEVKP